MPVGCLGTLGGGQGSSLYLAQDGTPASQAEKMELMQQTLLIQIFRLNSQESLSCSTCSSFSPSCCQVESGWDVLGALVRQGSLASWDPSLVRAVNSLSFQGYVCPGILVTAADGDSVTVLKECWGRHALPQPPGFRIFRLGLSSGCSVTPFLKGPSPSLSEAICSVLASLKRSDTLANMENILVGIRTDFGEIPAPKDFLQLVHKTLGSLIKARKVYYTGKGYFLVVPDPGEPRPMAWQEKYHRFAGRVLARETREGWAQTEGPIETTSYLGLTVRGGPSPSRPPAPTPAPTDYRGSPNALYGGSSRGPSASPSTVNGGPNGSPNIYNTPNHPSPNEALDTSESGESKDGSPRSPMERSQSFRLNKKAQKRTSKGGSLRLSKKDAAVFKDEADTSKAEEEEEEGESPTPKKMERKNSVLGRLFGRKNKSSSPKKEILTFNAQFPPPDLLEHMRAMARGAVGGGHTTQTQTPPQRKRTQVITRPPLPAPAIPEDRLQSSPSITSALQQVKNGPSGNFVMFERNGSTPKSSSPSGQLRSSPMSPNLSLRPLPQSPPPSYYSPDPRTQDPVYNIYSQPNYQTTKPLPPAYSLAPPYRPKDFPLPAPPRTVTSPTHPPKPVSPQKQVHFAASPHTPRSSPSLPPPRVGNSESGSSSLSGPSSLDSVLYDDSLASIEKSNQELEQRLGGQSSRVDTIHNTRTVEQHIIYEESLSDMSRSSSASTLKPDWGGSDHPSLADLGSIADLSAKFQSLTARKLMAGLSISSIDTLLEVNSDERNNGKLSILNESTETIDFGVI